MEMNNSTVWWVILIVVILLGSYFLFVNREPVEPLSPDVPGLPEVSEPLPEENVNETLPEDAQEPTNSGTGTSSEVQDEEAPAAE